ncbi:M41 family metallopeptidase, partial [Staphylococcus epidermidis]
KKSRVICEKEGNIVGDEEGGDSMMGMVVDEGEIVHKVRIVGGGEGGGYGMMLGKEDGLLTREAELVDKICGLLGG